MSVCLYVSICRIYPVALQHHQPQQSSRHPSSHYQQNWIAQLAPAASSSLQLPQSLEKALSAPLSPFTSRGSPAAAKRRWQNTASRTIMLSCVQRARKRARSFLATPVRRGGCHFLASQPTLHCGPRPCSAGAAMRGSGGCNEQHNKADDWKRAREREREREQESVCVC